METTTRNPRHGQKVLIEGKACKGGVERVRRRPCPLGGIYSVHEGIANIFGGVVLRLPYPRYGQELKVNEQGVSYQK
jgi:hypothetical protein